MRMAIDQAGHHQPQRGVDRFFASVFRLQIGGLTDRHDAILGDGDCAVGEDVPLRIESEQSAMLDQNIDAFHVSLVRPLA